MTLKEKFKKATSTWFDTTECEQIAEEFAIGFADWIRVCKMKGRGYDFDDVKQLLEIYKDEKDL
jgi:hypothetical protein